MLTEDHNNVINTQHMIITMLHFPLLRMGYCTTPKPKMCIYNTYKRETEEEREAEYVHVCVCVCVWGGGGGSVSVCLSLLHSCNLHAFLNMLIYDSKHFCNMNSYSNIYGQQMAN